MRLSLALIAAACTFGCATLPEVHPWVESAGARTPTMVGSRGPISRERAAKILTRLSGSGGSDLLTKHVAIEEEVSGAPLTLGNAAKLLYDGPATYRSMFEAIDGARDHVNIEFYIIEDDEVGRAFSDTPAAQGGAGPFGQSHVRQRRLHRHTARVLPAPALGRRQSRRIQSGQSAEGARRVAHQQP